MTKQCEFHHCLAPAEDHCSFSAAGHRPQTQGAWWLSDNGREASSSHQSHLLSSNTMTRTAMSFYWFCVWTWLKRSGSISTGKKRLCGSVDGTNLVLEVAETEQILLQLFKIDELFL